MNGHRRVPIAQGSTSQPAEEAARSRRAIPWVLRAAAIAIAVAGVVDPAITTPRRVRPDVAVVVVDSARYSALGDRVAQALRDDFRVLRAPFAGVAATVLVGAALPADAASLAGPVFVVTDDAGGVRIAAAEVPARAPLDGTVPVDVAVDAGGTRGTVEIALHAGGAVVDRVTLDGDDATGARLTFVPAALGAAPLRVTASADGEDMAVADLVVDIHDRPWAVLFYDTRPSWPSTFVRRSVERDARFDVAARVLTSRDASIGAGGAPVAIDAGTLARYDAVVVGAPDALRDEEVDALDAYLRRRGGAVILLPDHAAEGDRLTGVDDWASTRAAAPVALERNGGATLRATELRWPRALPPAAAAVARDSAGNAVLWRAPVGAGRLIVSGALDAWRFRGDAASGFDAFWPALLADAAAATPPPLDVRLARPVVRPGEETDVIVASTALALGGADAGVELQGRVHGAIAGPNVVASLRLWPEEVPGQWRAALRAPAAPGVYRVRVTSGDAEAEAPLLVRTDASAATPDGRALLERWSSARGGSVVRAADLHALPDLLAGSLTPVRRRATWHPLRAPWWIVPFALLLGVEWWWRRRRGLA